MFILIKLSKISTYPACISLFTNNPDFQLTFRGPTKSRLESVNIDLSPRIKFSNCPKTIQDCEHFHQQHQIRTSLTNSLHIDASSKALFGNVDFKLYIYTNHDLIRCPYHALKCVQDAQNTSLEGPSVTT